MYGTLKIDEPQLLFTVLHPAGGTVPEEDFTRTVTALQYQKVMTENDITHCLHGVPYEPNCGGFYP